MVYGAGVCAEPGGIPDEFTDEPVWNVENRRAALGRDVSKILRSAGIDKAVKKLVCPCVDKFAPSIVRVELQTGTEVATYFHRQPVVNRAADWKVSREEAGKSILGIRRYRLGEELRRSRHRI